MNLVCLFTFFLYFQYRNNRVLFNADFGLEYLVSFAKKTTFPWLMSNVFLKNTDIPLGEGKVTHVLEKNGIRIGLVGLIEEEWLYTLVMDPNDIHYVNFITEGRRLAKQLREQVRHLVGGGET